MISCSVIKPSNSLLFCAALLLNILSASKNVYASNEPAPILPPVSVFSTYLSEPSSAECNLVKCQNDFIPVDMFFEVLAERQVFVQAAPSADGFDYEILIANALKSNKDNQMTTEIDVTWRGIPLASYQFSALNTSANLQAAQKLQMAVTTINAFIEKAMEDRVFAADYLFNKLDASNYPRDLKLPATIATFSLHDMQLYRDPFQGAVARYTHPDYSREVLDVFVYPITGGASHDEVENIADPLPFISKELDRDIEDIKLVASARDIGEISISQLKSIDWHVEQRDFRGHYFDVEAEDEQGEPLYTTTYLFISKDKFIKFSANFPARIADPMVKNALPLIDVPEPSALMLSLRQNKGVTQ